MNCLSVRIYCLYLHFENSVNVKMTKGKPFIKWVGGKTQLLEQLDAQLPVDFGDWGNVTYIEPFVGGGAMLFYMLQHYILE